MKVKLRLRALKLRQTLHLFFLKIRGLFHLRLREYGKRAVSTRRRKLELEFMTGAKILLVILLVIGATQLFFYLRGRLYMQVPAEGGFYREAVVGSFSNLNPIYSPANAVDQDAVSLLYGGLYSVGEGGALKLDLASKYTADPDGKTYHVTLRPGLKWQDGAPLTADDVVFTIDTIENPDAASPPLIQKRWKGVSAEKVSDLEVKFVTPKTTEFQSYLTQPLIPSHLLKSIPVKNLAFYDTYNLNPIGSGRYQFTSLRSLSDGQELTLTPNPNYDGPAGYLDGVVLRSYQSEREALNGLEKHDVMAIAGLNSQHLKEARELKGAHTPPLAIAEETALFMNTKSTYLTDIKFRAAVAGAIDSAKVVELGAPERYPAYGPLLPGYLGYDPSARGPRLDRSAVEADLDALGYKRVGGAGRVNKKNEPIVLSLVALGDPGLDSTVEAIVQGLREVGIETAVSRPNLTDYEASFVVPRKYDLLIASENLGYDADPYFYWDSSQAASPGLNLSQYASSDADKLLDAARRSADPAIKAAKYRAFQSLIAADVPAVFLYGSYYYYLYTDEVHLGVGDYERLVEAKDRFATIGSWYIETKWMKRHK